MQYGRFRTGNTLDIEPTTASIGTLLENEFEQKGMPTELPTAADWGYTFRTKIGKQVINISVVDHDEDGFGIALEPAKTSFNSFFSQDSKGTAIEVAKPIVTEALGRSAANSTLVWYSKSEWLEAFDTDFWQPRN